MNIYNNKKNLFILSIIIIIGLILSFQTLKKAASKIVSDFFSPYLSLPSRIVDNMSNQSLLLRSKLSLAGAIEELQRKTNELYGKAEILKGMEQENIELRQLLGLKSRPEYDCIFAELLLRDPVYWDERFTIRKGLIDGIQVGSPVLAKVSKGDKENPDGLAVVGRIRTVTKHTAVVDTLISGETKLSVKLAESQTPGVIQYGGRNGNKFWAKISYLPRNIDYVPGEAVYTSGLSGYTIPYLYVGRLSENPDEIKVHDNLYIEAKLDMAANIDALRFVIVMVKKK